MIHLTFKLTVLFQEPFWVGICEREYNGLYEVCRITFGAEPRDYEIADFVMTHWEHLKFSPALPGSQPAAYAVSPKRRQRMARKETLDKGISTKAQQAIRLAYEASKMEAASAKSQRKKQKAESRPAVYLTAKQKEAKTSWSLIMVKIRTDGNAAGGIRVYSLHVPARKDRQPDMFAAD